ncbi:hypothetical protein AGMMS50218_15190 [Actinomycetota bacterium]|nr:hypothetical protein AGMMS50218_15190 [Actinomycetota bacterium]
MTAATTPTARPGPAGTALALARHAGSELLDLAPAARAWWAGKDAGARHRARVAGTGVLTVGVVALLTAGWWDPAIEAVFDAVGGWIANAAADAIAVAANQLMSLAFNNPLTELSDTEWSVATAQAARWGAVFAIVAVGVCALEVICSLIARDSARALRAGVVAALAWPMTVAALLALAELVAVTDGLSGRMFDSIGGDGAAGAGAAATAMGAAMGGITALTVGGGWPVIVIGALVCIIGLISITMVMAARAFGLVVATGFAPVALMLVGFKGTRAMARKWVEVTGGLLLTKPLAAGIVVLCIELAGTQSLDAFIMGTVGIWVAVFSPAIAMSLVSFAGGQISAALTAHAGAVKGAASAATEGAATKLAMEGIDSEALGRLGSQAAGLAKAAGAALGGLGAKLAGLGTGQAQSTPEDSEPPAAPDQDPTTDGQDTGPDTPTMPDQDQDQATGAPDPAGQDQGPQDPAATEGGEQAQASSGEGLGDHGAEAAQGQATDGSPTGADGPAGATTEDPGGPSTGAGHDPGPGLYGTTPGTGTAGTGTGTASGGGAGAPVGPAPVGQGPGGGGPAPGPAPQAAGGRQGPAGPDAPAPGPAPTLGPEGPRHTPGPPPGPGGGSGPNPFGRG